jgi:hypothetical protein
MIHHSFVVVTSSRTGSTWLMDYLDKVPGVASYGELFLGHERRTPAIATRSDYPRFFESEPKQRLPRPFSVLSYLVELYRPEKCVGFKLMYSQLRAFPEVVAFCAFRRIRILHLVRENLVDVIISDELAKATGRSHYSGQPQAIPMVYLDPAILVGRLHRRYWAIRRARWLLRLTTCPCLEVTYERLIDGQTEFPRIAQFLGLGGDLAGYRSHLSKRGRGTHADAIVNYEEVRVALRETRFVDMLR